MKKMALVYHSTDIDGLMSGYLLSKLYSEHISSGISKLIGYNYEDMSEFMDTDTYDRFVFVDVTPPIGWLKQLDVSSGVDRILIYDHHKDKYEQITKLNNKLVTYYFRNYVSGCKILFDVLYKFIDNDFRIKKLCQLISDYDTWKFVDKDFSSNKKTSVLRMATYLQQHKDLESFTKIVDSEESDLEWFVNADNKGQQLIDEIQAKNVDIIKNGKYYSLQGVFIFENVNTNYFLQEQIMLTYPDCKYMINWKFDFDSQQTKYSLRSKTVDNCHLIAKEFGGGGHPKAAGFNTKELIDIADLLAVIGKMTYSDNA